MFKAFRTFRTVATAASVALLAAVAHGATTRYVELRSTLQPATTGPNVIFVSSGTVLHFNMTDGTVTSTFNVLGLLRASIGTTALPGISFGSETGTGFTRNSPGVISLSLLGANYYNFLTGSFRPSLDGAQDLGAISARWQSIYVATTIFNTATSNQITLGTTRTVTITAPTPASTSRTVTIPDVNADASFVMTEGTQTINGPKTLTGQLILNSTPTLRSGLFVSTAGVSQPVFEVVTSSADFTMNGSSMIVVTPSGVAIKGVTTNSSASTGYVGEVVETIVTRASGVSATSSSAWFNVSVSTLTAGDWLISAMGLLNANGATITANTSSIAISIFSANTTTDHVTGSNTTDFSLTASGAADGNANVPCYHLQLTASTPIYLKMVAGYSVATPKGSGRLTAVRIR